MLAVALAVIVAVAGADQLIKAWITREFALYEERPFLHIGDWDILHLHYVENTGSAFSSFSGQRLLLVTVTVLAVNQTLPQLRALSGRRSGRLPRCAAV